MLSRSKLHFKFFLCSYYAEAYKSLRGQSPRHCARATELLSKKCCSGGEPVATLYPIWPAGDLKLGPATPETNALPLDHLLKFKMVQIRYDQYQCHSLVNFFLVGKRFLEFCIILHFFRQSMIQNFDVTLPFNYYLIFWFSGHGNARRRKRFN